MLKRLWSIAGRVRNGIEISWTTPFGVEFTIPKGVSEATVRLFDAAGRQLAHQSFDDLDPGPQVLRWPSDDVKLSSGVYWVRLEASGQARVASLRLIR